MDDSAIVVANFEVGMPIIMALFKKFASISGLKPKPTNYILAPLFDETCSATVE